ncbi:MAG: hypothetical protein ACTTID_00145 [Bacillales bacterium]
MELSYITLILYLSSILFFIAGFLTEYFLYKDTGRSKYSFLKNFPYELNRFKLFSFKTYPVLALSLFGSFLYITAGIIFFIYFKNISGLFCNLFLLISIFIMQISFIFIRFIKLNNYTAHLVNTSIYVCSNLLLLCLEYIFFTNVNFNFTILKKITIINTIVILILIISQFILMINPTHKNWAKCVDFKTELNSRPKISYLALLEWGTFFISILAFIPFICVLFK